MKYFILIFLFISNLYAQSTNKVVYLVSDIRIPFWNIMAKGIENQANKLGYDLEILSAHNIKKNEMQNLSKALSENIKGLIISPINSSTAATILKLAKANNKPVVISDIGTDSGDYVSFISSNNFQGAYEIGKILALKMKQLGWDKDGSVGIISIPQKRANGKARTAGFMEALNQYGIKGAGLLQQVDFSHKETYAHAMKLIKNNPNLKALWLQGSDRYQAALDAIKDSGKQGEILLLCFDAEPEFLDLIPKGVLVGAAMQQPYLMGQQAMEALDQHLQGKKVVKNNQLEVLAISTDNISEKIDIIKTNVLGIEKP